MKNIFTFVFLSLALSALSQESFRTAITTSANSDAIIITNIVQLDDGSYIGAATKSLQSIVLVKLNAQGSLIAQKTITSPNRPYISSLIKTSDGGFAIAGSDSTAFVSKYDANLNLQWQKEYGFLAFYKIYIVNKLLQTKDGSYVMAGRLGTTDGGSQYGYISKIDNSGNYINNTFYLFDFGSYNELDDVISTRDGNLALLDVNFSSGIPITHILKIAPITASTPPAVIWAKSIEVSTTNGIAGNHLIQTLDGGFVFSGSDGSNTKTAICKLDSSGNMIWSKRVITLNNDYSHLYSVAETKDSNYIFAGSYYEQGISSPRLNDTAFAFITKFASNGNLQWNKTFNYTNREYSGASSQFDCIINTNDSGFVLSGVGYQIENTFYQNGVIYKFDSAMNICGNATYRPTTFTDAGATSVSFSPNMNNYNPIVVSSSLTEISSNLLSANLCEILPVQLLSFNAVLQNKSVNVAWKTTSEINTDHFVVERSNDARTFTSLQTIAAKGNNAANIESYATTDLQPLQGISYYRLKEVDKEGKITYSTIASVTMLTNGMLVISPNPVHNNMHVVLQSQTSGQATFIVSDVTGKIVAKQKNIIVEGTNTFQIPSASLSKGMYVLKVIQNNTVQSVKFIKQ